MGEISYNVCKLFFLQIFYFLIVENEQKFKLLNRIECCPFEEVSFILTFIQNFLLFHLHGRQILFSAVFLDVCFNGAHTEQSGRLQFFQCRII